MSFVERMKWWHWVGLSLVLGALLAFLNSGGADTAVEHRSVSTVTFETGLLLQPWVDPKDSSHRRAWMSDLMVHPVQDVATGDKIVKLQLVSFTRLTPPDAAHPGGETHTEYMWAPFPYEATPRGGPNQGRQAYPAVSLYFGKKGDTLNSLAARFYHKDTPMGVKAIIDANPSLRDAKGPADLKIQEWTGWKRGSPGAYWIPWNPADQHTISDFLVAANQFIRVQQGQAAIPISFHYRWWESSKYGYEAWMIGTFLIVGVIWPTLLAVMIKGGLGRMTPQEYDLSRFKSGPEPSVAAAPAAVVSKSDMQRLRELEESMEATLKATAAPSAGTAPPPEVKGAPAEVKKLGGGPDEAPPLPMVPEEKKDYQGEYYPVAKPHVPKDEKH
ncbi:MAG: LysM domain-containing protein [Tepidisphaeraceae bacterium]|jgi:nucleoid-associated protein YgaU